MLPLLSRPALLTARRSRSSRILRCPTCQLGSSASNSRVNNRDTNRYWAIIKERPIEYFTIPCVAAFVGIMTNWMGVKMLFYPIEYVGVHITERDMSKPYNLLFGWQGVVPTKSQVMGRRLCNIVTQKLLSLQEAFARLHPQELSTLLLPAMSSAIQEECGPVLHAAILPILPYLLPVLLQRLQNDIDNVLDLQKVVLDAFLRDKAVLVELFQKVGRVELDFLVNSGFGLGFLLGLGQTLAWVARPMAWTLPVAGALVGYVTNWVAIKFIFEPAEPVEIIPHILRVQGLFESRQIEVSDEFGAFMERRVLNSTSLLKELARDGVDGDLFRFLRAQLPYPIPESVVRAAVQAIDHIADNPRKYPEVHQYIQTQLDISDTLSARLKLLSPTEFEDLLHPVFQEDELTLIVTGGVLGAIAGVLQTNLGWGGPKATMRAFLTILGTMSMSAGFYLYQKYEELEDDKDPPVSASSRPNLRRRVTILQMPLLEDENMDWFGDDHRDH